jgi:acyl carrier protein
MRALTDSERFTASLAEISTVDEIGTGTLLADLGLESAAFLTWFYRLEDEYGVRFGEEGLLDAFGEGVTVGGLYDVLTGIVARAARSTTATSA